MTWSIFLFLVLKGLLDNVLSDYLWARAVILTSATVASVSVGLTIPMAFAADILMGNDDSHGKGDILGAVLVLIGFVFVNIDGAVRNNETREEVDGELEFDHNSGVDTGGVRDMEILS
jgi:solute carrier family 35 protein F5